MKMNKEQWSVEDLSGKYYGTRVVSDNGGVIVVWTGFDNSGASIRERNDGWEEGDGYDHIESQRDFEIATIICDALNNRITNE